MFLGAKRFGSGEQREKISLILDRESFRYQKYISDLAGQDIRAHGQDPREAIRIVRNWLSNAWPEAPLPGGDAMAGSGPGFKNHPEHRVATAPARQRVQVRYNGEIIADTIDAVRLDEASYPPVYYVPRRDVKMDRLMKTSHHTYCPFKGEASYWSAEVGGQVHENLVWSYETPIPQAEGITGLMCFYPDRVELTVDGERQPA